MVARLTPDQKAACSNHVGVSSQFLLLLFGDDLNLQRAGQKREKREMVNQRGERKLTVSFHSLVIYSANTSADLRTPAVSMHLS